MPRKHKEETEAPQTEAPQATEAPTQEYSIIIPLNTEGNKQGGISIARDPFKGTLSPEAAAAQITAALTHLGGVKVSWVNLKNCSNLLEKGTYNFTKGLFHLTSTNKVKVEAREGTEGKGLNKVYSLNK